MHGRTVVVWVMDGAAFPATDYGHRVARLLRRAGCTVHLVPCTERGLTDDELGEPCHVLTGGVTPVDSGAGWMDRTVAQARELLGQRTRAVGICLGAQILATAARAGSTGPSARGAEVGMQQVRALWSDLAVEVCEHHYQEVTATDGELLFTNDHTRVQGFALDGSALGYQFHPEFGPADARRLIPLPVPGVPAPAAGPKLRWTAETFHALVTEPLISDEDPVTAVKSRIAAAGRRTGTR